MTLAEKIKKAEKNEPRLIDANALLWKAIEEKRFVFQTEDLIRKDVVIQTAYHDLADFIDSAPTVDAVPVVRCGECARRYTELCFLCEKAWRRSHAAERRNL